ncbi:TIGR01212 family radical SAM protein [Lachnoanaerobaculum orale]|uniref:TIGR01212 family radical SAM protein n=1 Tax=Lachnoanaerobaculum orale TaxID=979627 RepID=A0A3P3Q4S8_9FIRM|nr:TIGR01212 family radical SAM protein [Lachnoanaerobaculum orale]RRJ16028.1 TIGR01212 family radical SAM protein [Lachnoanaerobaculum orale]
MKRLSDYCKEKFGTKVYRLALSSGATYPNRDGKVGVGGCSFCSEKGSGEFAIDVMDLDLQIERAKALISKKFPNSINAADRKYIAYFQSFSNTYGDTKRLIGLFERAINKDEVVALSVATRPDCFSEEMLNSLERLNKIKPVWIELGLQTINENTARAFNRGYTLDVFEKTYTELKKRNFEVIVHMILGLPGESEEDMYATVKYLSKKNIDGIKIHGLHILKGTRLASEYEKHPFKIMSLEEYTRVLINCLKLLPKDTVVHRMTGDGDKRVLIEPQWSADKKRVLNYINKKIKEELL